MIAVLLAASVVLQDGTELYARMARAIGEAEGTSARVEAEARSGELKTRIEGTVAWRAPNRLKIELTIRDESGREDLRLTCDGERAAETAGGSAKVPVAAPPDLRSRFVEGQKALGAVAASLLAGGLKVERRNRNDVPDFGALLSTAEFFIGADERVGDVETKVIRYQVAVKGGPTLVVKAWLDARTWLPVKREVSGEVAGMRLEISESTTWGEAPPVDSFKLPE